MFITNYYIFETKCEVGTAVLPLFLPHSDLSSHPYPQLSAAVAQVIVGGAQQYSVPGVGASHASRRIH